MNWPPYWLIKSCFGKTRSIIELGCHACANGQQLSNDARQVGGGQEAAGVPQRRDGSRSTPAHANFLLGYHGTTRSGRCHSQDLQPELESSASESIDMLFSGGEDWARRSWPRQLPLWRVPCHAQRMPALACEDPPPSPSRPPFQRLMAVFARSLLILLLMTSNPTI